MGAYHKFYQGLGSEVLPVNIPELDLKADEYLIEEKHDGIWADVHWDAKGKVHIMSRPGKEKTNKPLTSLISYLEDSFSFKNVRIIGECAFSTQKGTEYITEHGHSKVDVFDILIDGKNDYTKGLDLLARKAKLAEKLSIIDYDESYINIGWWQVYKSPQQVQKLFDGVVKGGGEGVVIKKIDTGAYIYGSKHPDWYKIKKAVDFDYVIMGFTETKSADFKAKGWIGAVVGGLFVDGELTEKISVGSMNFDMREKFSKNPDNYIGKVMEVSGFELFRSGALRHPSFSRLRDDKLPKECVWSV